MQEKMIKSKADMKVVYLIFFFTHLVILIVQLRANETVGNVRAHS